MTVRDRLEYFPVFSSSIRINRAEIFGPRDEQLPASEISDAHLPQIGFIGANYGRGGDILLGINPGGGGDAYRRTPADSVLLPKIDSLRRMEATEPALREVFDQYAANMRTWNLWRIVGPVLAACGREQAEIAYLNWCPFRTRGDKMPSAQAMTACHRLYLAHLITTLAPRRLIALGKKAGDWLKKTPFGNAEKFVVPRTIGDSYLSPAALSVLEEIRASTVLRVTP